LHWCYIDLEFINYIIATGLVKTKKIHISKYKSESLSIVYSEMVHASKKKIHTGISGSNACILENKQETGQTVFCHGVKNTPVWPHAVFTTAPVHDPFE